MYADGWKSFLVQGGKIFGGRGRCPELLIQEALFCIFFLTWTTYFFHREMNRQMNV